MRFSLKQAITSLTLTALYCGIAIGLSLSPSELLMGALAVSSFWIVTSLIPDETTGTWRKGVADCAMLIARILLAFGFAFLTSYSALRINHELFTLSVSDMENQSDFALLMTKTSNIHRSITTGGMFLSLYAILSTVALAFLIYPMSHFRTARIFLLLCLPGSFLEFYMLLCGAG